MIINNSYTGINILKAINRSKGVPAKYFWVNEAIDFESKVK